MTDRHDPKRLAVSRAESKAELARIDALIRDGSLRYQQELSTEFELPTDPPKSDKSKPDKSTP